MTQAVNSTLSPTVRRPLTLQERTAKLRQGHKLFWVKAGIYSAAALAFVGTGGQTYRMRQASEAERKPLLDDIRNAQIASLSQSLQIVLSGPERGKCTQGRVNVTEEQMKDGLLLSYRTLKGVVGGGDTRKAAERLAKMVFEIRNQIEQIADGKGTGDCIARLRSDLSRAMHDPVYQLLKEQDSEAVNFLQFVAIKLIAADGTKALLAYGKKCLGNLQEDAFSPIGLADLMRAHLKRPGFSYKGLNRVVYTVCHPELTAHSAESVLDPLGYDGSKGNPTFSGHSFVEGDKKMIFYFGPGPTGNPIFEHGVLPAYEKFGVFELRFNHQDTIKRSEYFRVKEIVRMGERNPAVLRHALLGFDTKMTNNKSVDFKDPDMFFETYREYVLKGVRGHKTRSNHTGFHIPDRLLSDADLDLAIGKAQEFCSSLSLNNPFWDQMMRLPADKGAIRRMETAWHRSRGNSNNLYPLMHPGKARMAKMMQLITDTYLTLGMIYRSFDQITPEMVERTLDEKLDRDLTALRTSGACKQNVDRAVVENISLRLLFRWSKDPRPLTREEVYEISGAVFGRARLVDDRQIMHNRYRILDDLLRFIGSAPGGVDAAHALLKGYRSSLWNSSSWFSFF